MNDWLLWVTLVNRRSTGVTPLHWWQWCLYMCLMCFTCVLCVSRVFLMCHWCVSCVSHMSRVLVLKWRSVEAGKLTEVVCRNYTSGSTPDPHTARTCTQLLIPVGTNTCDKPVCVCMCVWEREEEREKERGREREEEEERERERGRERGRETQQDRHGVSMDINIRVCFRQAVDKNIHLFRNSIPWTVS